MARHSLHVIMLCTLKLEQRSGFYIYSTWRHYNT